MSYVEKDNHVVHNYPRLTKTIGSFKLEVEEGTFEPGNIVVLLG